ncbi:MAG TPA: peptidoglycan-binding domain-containing protein [Polyangia bacterium]|jgi:peptidoglycan hydrolase-like protein with peptidoglycan-binding domain|nr:peptidoglycan-binding domain-containing protein [Polyangia bacterium]
MTTRLVVFICVAAVALACGHARTVGPADTARVGDRKSDAVAAEAPAKRPPAQRSRDDEASGGEEGVPLATSPGGLLRPGAIKMIQQRLSSAGALPEERQTGELDVETRSALRRFQEANGLPATGDPDGATVGKLGLKANDVFKTGEASGK